MKRVSENKKKAEEKRAKAKKNNLIWKIIGFVLFAIQAVASAFAFQEAYMLGMFPDLYLIVIGAVFIILLILNFLLLFAGTKKNLARVFRRSLAIVLVIAVCISSVYLGILMTSVRSAVNEITTTESTESESESIAASMEVYIISHDSATSLADCKAYTFGVAGGNDGPSSFAAVTKINEELGEKIADKEYPSTAGAAKALYKGEVGAIIIDRNYVKMLNESTDFADFTTWTKLVATIDITTGELAAAEASNPYSQGNDDKVVDIAPATHKVDNIEVEPFIVYISGSDTREEYFQAERSDVNILMVVNPQTKQILLLNTPRDYFIPNPRSAAGTEDKLTHLGIYGVDCSITGLENLYDCDINYYVQINFTGAETLVDDLGGITFYNPNEFTGRGVYFPEGEITLNGEEAVIYARERYAFVDGDNMRGQNQMRLITAIIKRFTSPDTTTLLKYNIFLDDLDGFMVTNLESDEINNLVKMQMSDMASWNIQTYAVTGWGEMTETYSMPGTDLYVCHPYWSTVYQGQDLIDKVLDGEIITDDMVE